MFNKKDRKIALVVGGLVGILLIILLIAEIVKVSKEARYVGMENGQTNTITVTGKGEVKASPNMATFSFSVQADGDTQAAAQSSMATQANTALEYLKVNGVADKDIQTADYNVSQKYKNVAVSCSANVPCPVSNQQADGFTASESVNVTLHDLSKSGSILSGVANAGATNVSSLSLSSDNDDSLADQAREKAIDDAKDKAATLAHQLGVHLIRIESFSENGVSPIPMYKSFGTADMASAPATPEIQTGENTITSNVTITYEIR